MHFEYTFPTTDKIVASHVGPLTGVPGLPNDDTRTKALSILTAGAPSLAFYEELDRKYGDEHLLFLFTVDEMSGFREYVPSTYHRLAKTFPKFGSPINENRRRILQLQSELQTKISTNTSGLINADRRNRRGVLSKVRQLWRISNLASQLGIPVRSDVRQLGPFTNDRLEDILADTTQGMIDLFEMIEWPDAPCSKERFTPKFQAGDDHKYGYMQWLLKTLGDNCTGITVYGSATQHDRVEEYSDYDNWVKVHDVRAAIEALKNTSPHYDLKTGKMILRTLTKEEEQDEHIKHVGILLFPEEGKMFNDYVRFLHDMEEFKNSIKVLYGAVELQTLTRPEEYDRMISQADNKGKTQAGALPHFFRDTQTLVDRQPLAEYLWKHTRFLYKHAMKRHTGKLMDKIEADRQLKEQFGIIIPKFRPDASYLREAIFYARSAAAHLQTQLLKGVLFDGSYFTSDKITYTGHKPVCKALVLK